jgi:hypothetical protein
MIFSLVPARHLNALCAQGGRSYISVECKTLPVTFTTNFWIVGRSWLVQRAGAMRREQWFFGRARKASRTSSRKFQISRVGKLPLLGAAVSALLLHLYIALDALSFVRARTCSSTLAGPLEGKA